ncbi:MAG: FAD-binding oxidoreductase [Trueperaceae bacterium]|nr:MAG: FAD-binding oxidoreductase [Trueperaceae bacterium]
MIDGLRAALRGDVIDPAHAEYDAARSVWNGLIDRHPAVIARCADAADAAEAVRLARTFRPPVSIRGGGHQVAGSAVCDDGLVIDLSAMRGVEVDADRRVALVQGGARWGDVDTATQRVGLAVPGGEVSTTGVAGFTLGGGMALTSRQFGLSCDNLRAVEVVTADGEVHRADRDQHADLFWAARGAGRGIGVVTSFEFDLHPLGPEVAAATVFYPYGEAGRILRAWRELAPAMPETVTPQLILWSVPRDPAIPEALHGEKCVIVTGVYAGPADEADAALAPLRRLVTPLHDMTATVSYVEQQSSVDDLFPDGNRYFMKALGFDGLDDAAIDSLLAWDARRPTPESLIALRTLGGAVARVGSTQSAFPHRRDRFNLSIDAGWSDPGQDASAIGWARGMWDALRPFSNGGVYVNFAGLDDDAGAAREHLFGDSAKRLADVRTSYDPEGVFAAAAQRP